jgi:tryptophan synthase beta chain
MSPLISHIYESGLIEAEAKTQKTASRPGCSSPAPRASCRHLSRPTRWPPRSHEAIRCKETGEEKVILTALCGHGHLDLPAYDAYLRGDLVDHTWEDTELQEAVAQALTKLPSIPG